jgi:hypothetical protein
MKKTLILGLIVLSLVLLVGCKAGGKAIAAVPGDPATQATAYMDSAEQALLVGDYQTAGAYLIHADNAINQVPYNNPARNQLRERYNGIYSTYLYTAQNAAQVQ